MIKHDTTRFSGALKELDSRIKKTELAKRRLAHVTKLDEWAQQGIREATLREVRELFGRVEAL